MHTRSRATEGAVTIVVAHRCREALAKIDLSGLDRWGQKLYEGKADDDWDGTWADRRQEFLEEEALFIVGEGPRKVRPDAYWRKNARGQYYRAPQCHRCGDWLVWAEVGGEPTIDRWGVVQPGPFTEVYCRQCLQQAQVRVCNTCKHEVPLWGDTRECPVCMVTLNEEEMSG